jgi:transposase
VLEETPEDAAPVERVAALDIGKAEVVCCVRVPHPSGSSRRVQEVRTFTTMTRSLQGMADWLAGLGVTRIVMEATSDYWKPPFYLLEAAGFDVWLVNAREVKHLPGRPKTDKLDAVWLCRIAERGMVRASFVPPAPIRLLRDVTRYRIDLVGERSREKNRVEKLLEDAQIKLSVVASDIFGVSGRAMMAALIAGQRDPKILAQLARSRMRTKLRELEEAFVGRFSEHHAFLLTRMLARIDTLDADIAAVEDRIEELAAPFTRAVTVLDEIPGIGATAARAIIAEIGVDMSRFPTAAHLAAWAGLAPAMHESAGKQSPAGKRHGNKWLTAMLVEAAGSVGRMHGKNYLAAQHARLLKRRGMGRAQVAVAHSMLVSAYWMLKRDEPYHDLGADWHRRRSAEAHTRRLVAQLEHLGHTVIIDPAA